ncbi:ATP phosphoribosyltransferase [Parvularcula sp. IMCC14364]|uniref:ATP phosphoribosyltransferase n=1 Tax=Parvularcula sp. IMCC14364 TaxID=3067902 RepID=UPI0027410659|nr:ATP phosphoribosyltransferase [Parvularcula sp. IMCC14364]
MTDQEQRLRIAVQKKGQLADKSLQLFEQAGLKITRGANDLLYRAENFPADFLRVRDDDIPQFVASGACALGIVGENVLQEDWPEIEAGAVDVSRPLGFGHCTLKIAVPNEMDYVSPADLNGVSIATSYPVLLKNYLAQNGVSAGVVEMSGAVEVAPRLKVADVVCDLVSTGQTLAANGLRAVETVMKSEAVLIRHTGRKTLYPEDLLARLLRRVDGVLATRETKYIMMNAPESALDDIIEILPGAGAPTVTPLAGKPGQVAIHAVCQESVFWETLERLKAAGSSAILVLPIEKMML